MSTTTEAQEPFALVKERCTLKSLNIRAEKHGDEDIPAVDIDFSLTTSNSILKKLDARLLPLLYTHDKQMDIQDEFMRKLQFPLLGVLSWGLELLRMRLEVHDVESDANNVVMAGGKLKKVKINAKDGGTVEVSFQVQFSKADMDDAAKLARVLMHDVPVTLHQEAAAEEPDNFQQALELGQEPMSEGRAAAEAAFKAPPSDLQIDQAAAGLAAGAEAPDPAAKAAPKKRGKAAATTEVID